MKASVYIIFAVIAVLYAAAATEEDEEFGSGDIDEWSWKGYEENEINEGFEDLQSRISGGKNAAITKYPFMASVLVNGTLKGGASILNRKWLITGAFPTKFATEVSQLTVRVGSKSSFAGGKLCQAKRIVRHPKQRGYDYDVALIRLERPLSFSRHIRPIKMADKPPRSNTRVVFTSFGWNDDNTTTATNKDSLQSNGVGVLKETHFKFLEFKDCEPYYFDSLSFTKRCFCTQKSNRTSPESKDFGSPLVYGGKVLGHFSGVPCGKPRPAVFVDITKIKSWIFQTMKKYSSLE
ncbi:trypsin-7 [Nilaparvata lugens]|uniref:trypsin-7 n=1 Tax=Nilaparvata lugens TaxID=108931 RepID=UPI00193E0FAB|nr:trypsin-7 [Nilaparvata lugens]